MTEVLPHFSDLFNWGFVLFILILVLSLWIIVCVEAGAIPGWEALTQKYPDRAEPEIAKLRNQSGMMEVWFNLYGCLTIDVCPSGLRFEITKVFGVKMFASFYRKFFIPWDEMTIVRRKLFLQNMTELRFGQPSAGKLILLPSTAKQVAQIAGDKWAAKL